MFFRAPSIPVVLLAFHACLIAQTERTNLTGLVTDPQGNRIPQAKVIAVQTETGLRRQTATNSQGTYVLADLPLGDFIVQFSSEGFSTFQADHVRQVVGQTGTLNVTLTIAGKKRKPQ